MMAPAARRSWPVSDWPEPDGPLWLAAKAAATSGRLLGRGLAGRLRPASLWHYEEAYGAWVAFLGERGELGAGVAPANRVTPERLDGFVAVMLERGNLGISITRRLLGLYSALRILAPGHDWRWVARPGGVAMESLFDTAPRPRRPRSARELFDWGMELLATADQPTSPYEQALQLRDGLLIALLASRGMRLGELCGLTLGRSLFRPRGGVRWRMEWAPENRKAGGTLGYWVPEVVGPYLDHYLEKARLLLLGGRGSEAVWVSQRRGPLAPCGLQAIILRRSAACFGADQAFRPHVFRHALTTAAALEAPEHPGLAASILGHGVVVSEKHYNRASGVQAATAYGEVLDTMAKLGERELAVKLKPGEAFDDDDDDAEEQW